MQETNGWWVYANVLFKALKLVTVKIVHVDRNLINAHVAHLLSLAET